MIDEESDSLPESGLPGGGCLCQSVPIDNKPHGRLQRYLRNESEKIQTKQLTFGFFGDSSKPRGGPALADLKDNFLSISEREGGAAGVQAF